MDIKNINMKDFLIQNKPTKSAARNEDKDKNDSFSNALSKTSADKDTNSANKAEEQISSNVDTTKKSSNSIEAKEIDKSNDSIKENDLSEKDEELISKLDNLDAEQLLALLSQLLNGNVDLKELTSKVKKTGSDVSKISGDLSNLQDLIKTRLEALLNQKMMLNGGQPMPVLNELLGDISDNVKDELLTVLKQNSVTVDDSFLIKDLPEMLQKVSSNLSNELISKLKNIDNQGDKITGEDLIKVLTDGDDSLQSKILKELQQFINAKSGVSEDTNIKITGLLSEKLNKRTENTINSLISSKFKSDEVKEGLSVSSDVIAAALNSSKTPEKIGTELHKNDSQNKDDSLLKNLISGDKGSDDKDSKISKVTTFMAQFNNIKDTTEVQTGNDIVINRSNLAADMIKAVKYMETNNIKDLTVKITPKELGEVVIKLTMEGGIMKANITASNKEAYNIINSNLQDINGKLTQQDIKIQNFTLNIYNDDTTFFKQGSNRDKQNNSGRKRNTIEAIGDEDVSNESSILEDSNVNALV